MIRTRYAAILIFLQSDSLKRDRLKTYLVSGRVVAQLECLWRGPFEKRTLIDEIVLKGNIRPCFVFHLVPAPATGDVTRDNVALRRRRLILEYSQKPGIARSPELGFIRHSLEPLGHCRIDVVGGPAHGASVDMKSWLAIHKNVVLDGAIASASNEGGTRHLIKNVAVNLGAAEHIVQVNTDASASFESGNIVQIIMPDDRASHRPVASGIDCSGIVRFQAYVMDFIELDDVIVSSESDGHVRRIVDQVVYRPVTDTLKRNGGRVHARPSAVVMNMVIFGDMPGGCE